MAFWLPGTPLILLLMADKYKADGWTLFWLGSLYTILIWGFFIGQGQNYRSPKYVEVTSTSVIMYHRWSNKVTTIPLKDILIVNLYGSGPKHDGPSRDSSYIFISTKKYYPVTTEIANAVRASYFAAFGKYPAHWIHQNGIYSWKP
jgi:hypothetical protein